MATYKVTGPDGKSYKVTGPDGASDEDVLAQIKAYKPDAAPTVKPPVAAPGGDNDSAFGFVTGNLNKGVAGVAGMPVDTARNALNLGIAGYGAVKGALGGKPPDLIPNDSPGGSQWIEGKLRKAGSITDAAEPTSAPGRYGAAALQMIPGALTGRGTVAQLPAKAVAGMTSGVGAEAARDIGGDEWAGVGAMVPGAHKLISPPGVTERATAARKADAFGKAKELGVPVLPKDMKLDKVTMRAEDVVNRELGQPQGAEVSPASLKNYRSSFAPAYKAAQESKALAAGVVPNRDYTLAIDTIGKEIERNRQQMPETFKGMKATTDLLQEYGYGQPTQRPIPPDIAFRALKKLRSDATTNFQSGDPEKVELARVQKSVAGSLEKLIEDNLASDPQAMQGFREARQAIAKSHSVEEALDPATRKINPSKLSTQLTNGAPLSGDLEKLAQVSGALPSSTQSVKAPDAFTQRMSPMTLGHPAAVGAHVATGMLDPLRLSAPYQALMDPRRKLDPQMQQYLRYLAAAQAANRPDVPAPGQ